MNIGTAVHIVRGVKDLDHTITFYEMLGYHKLSESSKPNKWVLFTDGRINLVLDEGEKNFTGLIYFNPNLSDIIYFMKEQDVKFISKTSKAENLLETAIFQDPEGFGVKMVNQNYDSKLKPDIKANSTVDFGKFGEFSRSVKDLDSLLKFWTNLGYEIAVNETQPYPWAILIDGLMVLGLHQNEWSPGNTEPALTYFDPQMEEIIPKVENKGIKIEQFQEFTIESGNACVRAPDGLQIFLFKGDI